MSVLNAVRTALSGMNAESNALASISNNIANASTVGYKRVDTTFESLVLDGTSQGASSVAGTQALNRVDISKMGQVQETGTDTDIAINGSGMFVVRDGTIADSNFYGTRAGSFRPDADGNLVNAAGYYLQGIPLDATGKAIGNVGDNNLNSLSTVNVSNVSFAASPTTKMTFTANLPYQNTKYDSTTSQMPADNKTVVEYYDSVGNTQTLTFEFAPAPPTATYSAATNTESNKWTLTVYDSASVSSTNTTGAVATEDLEFSTSSTSPEVPGTLNSVTASSSPPAGSTSGTYDSSAGTLTITTGGGQTLPITIGALHSASGLTQFDGAYVPGKMTKDGSAFGTFQSASITNDGQVIGTFSNGATRPLYQLMLAVVPNPDGMNPVHGDAYEFSRDAGTLRLTKPGSGSAGSTSGGALESSNVDLGSELTRLIETQRAYSSSATVIRTGDQMLDEATRLKQ